MNSPFKNMSLDRGIILVSIPMILVLAATGWSQAANLRKLRTALEDEMPRLGQEIQQLSLQHTALSAQIDGDELVAQENPNGYIRAIAARDMVEIGDVKITPQGKSNLPGTFDHTYRISPADNTSTFRRSRLANFLYKLEEESSQVKVTSITFDIVGQGLRPEDLPADDLWRFKATLTSRVSTVQ